MADIRKTAGGALGLGVAALGALGVGELLRTRRRKVPGLDELFALPKHVEHRTFSMRDGAEIHVAMAGEGPAILLCHGVELQWWVWSSIFNLVSDRRIIAWDMRGHGQSTMGSEGISVGLVGRDLGEVLEQLDIEDVTVVGHSMGGMALMSSLIASHPGVRHRISHAVLLATSAKPVPVTVVGSVLESIVRYLRRHASETAITPIESSEAFGTFFVRAAFGKAPSGLAVEQVRQMVSELSAPTALAAWESIAGFDISDQLSVIDTPTSVVVGSRDLLTPVYHARFIERSIRGATLTILGSVGHQVMQEAPESLADLLRDASKSPARRGALSASVPNARVA